MRMGRQRAQKIATHAFKDNLHRYGEDPTRSALQIDAINAFNEIDRQENLDPVTIHAQGIARYVQIIDGAALRLVCRLTLIRLWQGTQQRDPLGGLLFSFVLHANIESIQEDFRLDLNTWCSNNGTLAGPIAELAKGTAVPPKMGPAIVHHLEVTKSKL